MSEKNIYQKIIDFQKSMPAITKTGTNPFFKSKYAPLEIIQKAIQKPLAEAGLGYTQEATNEGLKTTVFDSDGNTITSLYPAVFKGKPQEIGSAVTYAKRYSLTALLGLIIEGEDDDGNTAQNSNQTYQKKPTQNYQKPTQNITWLTQEQLNSTLQGTQEQANLVLAKYSTPTHKMKKEYREKIKNFINNEITLDEAIPDMEGQEF